MGVVVAAVLLSAPRFRVPPAMLDVLARSVADTAAEVSARLGGGTAPEPRTGTPSRRIRASGKDGTS